MSIQFGTLNGIMETSRFTSLLSVSHSCETDSLSVSSSMVGAIFGSKTSVSVRISCDGSVATGITSYSELSGNAFSCGGSVTTETTFFSKISDNTSFFFGTFSGIGGCLAWRRYDSMVDLNTTLGETSSGFDLELEREAWRCGRLL